MPETIHLSSKLDRLERLNTVPRRDVLGPLLREGHAALVEENDCLTRAFRSSAHADFYEGVSHGLAYGPFETTLAYVIFKRWLLTARVRWEDNYPGRGTAKADLVTYDEGGAQFVFEAKFWPNEHQKTLSVVREDLEKMTRWEGDVERILLAFWFSPDAHAANDRSQVETFCGSAQLDGSANQRPELIFLDYVRTAAVWKGLPHADSHMAFAALRLVAG